MGLLFRYVVTFSSITYHSKDMADVKVFADGQAKNCTPPIFRYGGIKKKFKHRHVLTGKVEALCHSRCGTIKTPPCSKALSAEHRALHW
jgi:hypothetical protein